MLTIGNQLLKAASKNVMQVVGHKQNLQLMDVYMFGSQEWKELGCQKFIEIERYVAEL